MPALPRASATVYTLLPFVEQTTGAGRRGEPIALRPTGSAFGNFHLYELIKKLPPELCCRGLPSGSFHYETCRSVATIVPLQVS